MTTEEIMSLALGMSGYLRIPEDSGIFVPGKGIRKVLFGLDVGTAELQLAKTMGADLVIAHHPPATAVEVWKIFLRHVEFMTAAGVPEDAALAAVAEKVEGLKLRGDRKSTRLNSSHVAISYAVFCLKKKTVPSLAG